jgi:diguanylate cyclase (GGDEF)-like protein
MTGIDPRTVFLLVGVLSGFMAMILYALRRTYPPTIQGLGEWAMAFVLVSVASLLGMGMGRLHSLLSMNLPRLLLPAGLLIAYVGTQRFFGAAPRYRRWIVAITMAMALHLLFTYGYPSFIARQSVATALSTVLLASFALFVHRREAQSFGSRLTTLVLFATSAVTGMRFVTLLLFPSGESILDMSLMQTVYVVTFAFCIFPLGVGLILMATERLINEMRYLASHDALTGALNRRHLNAAISAEIERSTRHGHRMALLVMDLDHFKAINDQHGHHLGDQVLVGFVAKASALMRRPDQLGRFGGEEFVALLPETDLAEAVVVAERIRQACATLHPAVGCTVSIGVATNATTGDTVDTLFARADAAMYRAKAQGRNRVETA